MTPEPVPGQAADALRASLRHGLTAALKARDRDVLSALRTAIAAIDNAQAIPVEGTRPPVTASAHVAGASSGAGATEAARRQLSASEVQDILRDQIAEHTREADRYDTLGQAEAAERLRRQARALAIYLQ